MITELAWNTADCTIDFIIYDRQDGGVTRATTIETSIGRIVIPRCSPGLVTPGHPIPGSVYLPTEHDETGIDEDQLRGELSGYAIGTSSCPMKMRPWWSSIS